MHVVIKRLEQHWSAVGLLIPREALDGKNSPPKALKKLEIKILKAWLANGVHRQQTTTHWIHGSEQVEITYGIQRGKKLTQRLQKGCNTYFATYEWSTPQYLYLCSAATPWDPMYLIFCSQFSTETAQIQPICTKNQFIPTNHGSKIKTHKEKSQNQWKTE